MTARICPDCGEEVTYRSCQQPNTDAIAELALAVHRRVAHDADPDAVLDTDLAGRAIVQAMAARDARDEQP